MQPLLNELRNAGWDESIIREYIQRKSGVIRDQPIISAINITRSFSTKPLLKDISFSVYPGEIFGIIGVSGVGKTTLLNILAGIDSPNSGRVISAKNTSIGFSTQSPSFYGDLTVLENCRYFMKLAGLPKKRIKRLLEGMGLLPYHKLLAKDLSGGLKKKLDIVLALLSDPDIILLDEPTADLDPISRKNLWKFIKLLNQRGKTIIIASHLLEEIEPLCSRVAVLNDAKIVDIGTPDYFREKIGVRYVVRLEVESAQYSHFTKGLRNYWRDGNVLVTSFQTQEEIFNFLQSVLNSGEGIIRVSVEHPSLGNIFSRIIS